MSGLPHCDSDLYKNGDLVGIYAANDGAKAFEEMIVGLREETGKRVDWHFAAGRAVVKCQPGAAQLFYDRLSELGYKGAL